MYNKSLPAKTSSTIPSRYFNFEILNWRKNLNESRRLQLKMLVKAYLHILSLDSKARYFKKYNQPNKIYRAYFKYSYAPIWRPLSKIILQHWNYWRPESALRGSNDNLPAVFELIFNFRCNGFMLFYYVLKELQRYLFETADALESCWKEK